MAPFAGDDVEAPLAVAGDAPVRNENPSSD